MKRFVHTNGYIKTERTNSENVVRNSIEINPPLNMRWNNFLKNYVRNNFIIQIYSKLYFSTFLLDLKRKS